MNDSFPKGGDSMGLKDIKDRKVCQLNAKRKGVEMEDECPELFEEED